jgi:hypothetical protein
MTPKSNDITHLSQMPQTNAMTKLKCSSRLAKGNRDGWILIEPPVGLNRVTDVFSSKWPPTWPLIE